MHEYIASVCTIAVGGDKTSLPILPEEVLHDPR